MDASLAVSARLSDRTLAVADAEGGRDRLADAIGAEIASVSETLGLARTVHVEIGRCDDPGGVPGPQIAVAGARLRYPEELLERVVAYTTGQYVPASAFPGELGSELLEIVPLVCRGAVVRAPAALADDAAGEIYARLLDGSSNGRGTPDPGMLLTVIRALWSQRIPLGDPAEILEAIERAGRDGWRSAAEALIARLRPHEIELRAPQELLESLTQDPESAAHFGSLREDAMRDLGVTLPPLRLVRDPAAKPQTFTITVNGLASLPWVALPEQAHAVRQDPSVLKEFVEDAEPQPIPSPHGGSPFSLISGADIPAARDAGYATIDRAEHVVLCARAILRSNARVFVDVDVIARRLAWYADGFSALIAAADQLLERELVVDVCRDLVNERLSIEDLPLILDRLLSAREEGAELERATAVVRAGMPRHILRRIGAGYEPQMVIAYLVAPEIEATALALARAHRGPGRGIDDGHPDADAVLSAFRKELMLLPSGLVPPVVLVSPSARTAVRNLLMTEFPRMHVVAQGELPRNANVQPIARISTEA